MKREKEISLLVPFTEQELRGRTKDVTRLFWDRANLEEEKKERTRAYNEQIATLSEEIADKMESLRVGGEFRDVRCVITYNEPGLGKKTIVRTDTGEVVNICDMDDAELQDMFIQAGEDEIPEGTEGTEGTEEFTPEEVAEREAVAEAAGIELCSICHTGGKLYRISGDRMICASCMLELPQEKRVKEMLNSGHAFRFRASCWQGGNREDVTNFRFIDDSPEARPADPWRTNSWGMGIWRPGNYLEEGTAANEFYTLLQLNPNGKED